MIFLKLIALVQAFRAYTCKRIELIALIAMVAGVNSILYGVATYKMQPPKATKAPETHERIIITEIKEVPREKEDLALKDLTTPKIGAKIAAAIAAGIFVFEILRKLWTH